MDTQIKKIGIYHAVSRLTKPIADSTHDISEIGFYVVELETEAGVFTLNLEKPASVAAVLEALGQKEK